MKKNIYTDDFKKQIVALQKNGKSISDLVTEYGFSRSTVFKWVHQEQKILVHFGQRTTELQNKMK